MEGRRSLRVTFSRNVVRVLRAERLDHDKIESLLSEFSYRLYIIDAPLEEGDVEVEVLPKRGTAVAVLCKPTRWLYLLSDTRVRAVIGSGPSKVMVPSRPVLRDDALTLLTMAVRRCVEESRS